MPNYFFLLLQVLYLFWPLICWNTKGLKFLDFNSNQLDCFCPYSLLCATATRLLCRTWEANDRAFGSLQVSFFIVIFELVFNAAKPYYFFLCKDEKWKAKSTTQEHSDDNWLEHKLLTQRIKLAVLESIYHIGIVFNLA